MFTHKHECLFCTLKFYHLHQNNSGVLGSPGLEFHLAIRNSGNCAASRHQFPQFYWLNSKDFFAGFWIQALGSGRFTRILQSEMEKIAPLVALKIWWLGCGMKLVRLEMETKFTPLESGIGGVRLLEVERAVQMRWSEAKHMASADCYKGFWMLNLEVLKLLVLPLQCELVFFFQVLSLVSLHWWHIKLMDATVEQWGSSKWNVGWSLKSLFMVRLHMSPLHKCRQKSHAPMANLRKDHRHQWHCWTILEKCYSASVLRVEFFCFPWGTWGQDLNPKLDWKGL